MQGDLYRQQQQQEALHIQQDQEQLQQQEQLLAAPQEMVEGAAHLEASQAAMAAPQLHTPVTEEQQASLGKFQRRRLRREEKARERQKKKDAQKEYEERDRLERETMARQATMDACTVKGLSQEQMQTHGVASFCQTLTEEEAQKVVEAANGFLYAKPNGDGTAQLKATLPEKAELVVEYDRNGKAARTVTMDFRKNFNLFQKLVVRAMLDETGAPTPERFLEISDYFSLVSVKRPAEARSFFSSLVEGEVFSSELSKMGYSGRALAKTKRELLDFLVGTCIIRDGCCFSTLGNNQSMGSGMGGTLNRLTLARTRPLSAYVDETARRLKEQGLPDDAIDREINDIISCYADSELARVELMKLRDLDIDSPDVALVNVCSDNSNMLNGFAKLLKRPSDTCKELTYQLGDNIFSDVPRAAAWVASRPPSFWERAKYKRERILELTSALSIQSEAERAQALQRLFQNSTGDLDTICKSELMMFFQDYGIYPAHRAMQVGLLNGSPITLETYAAIGGQYAAVPITQRIGVGLYKGGPQGFQSFYNQESWLMDQRQQKREALKLSLERGILSC